MPRFDVLPRNPLSCLTPAPQAESNQTMMPCDPMLGGGYWSVRGASAGAGVGAPAVGRVRAERLRRSDAGAGDDQLPLQPAGRLEPELGHRSDARIADAVPSETADAESELGVDVQRHDSSEAGAGALRRTVAVPASQRAAGRRAAQNGGFGRHTISTHEHNGHHGAENDGFTGAFFFPNQFYDYHWPIVLAGHFSMNTARHRSHGEHTGRQRRPDQRPRRLARDDEHALVPRPHVQLHVAERLQGQRRDVQPLQRPRSRQRGHRRRRQPAAAERIGEGLGQPRLRRQPDAGRQGVRSATARCTSTSSTSTASSAT